jgi:hypothetical protein
MCLSSSRSVLGLATLVIIAALSPVAAQQQPPAAGGSAVSKPRVLTGKERLGEKWTDEQRIDNCKVPVDKRGSKQRSAVCPQVPTG